MSNPDTTHLVEIIRLVVREEFAAAKAENAKLREALQRIVDEADSDNGLTAWDGGDIAREALAKTAGLGKP